MDGRPRRSEADLERNESRAVWEARRELGSDYERSLADSFADRIEGVVQRRSADDVRLQVAWARRRDAAGNRQLALAIVSVIACIPITLALALNSQMPALVISLLAIAAVNAAHAGVARGTREDERPPQ